MAYATEIAKAREELHSNHASSRPLSKDYDLLGVLGEIAMSLRYGVPFDAKLRPAGDGGRDVLLPMKFITDVKIARTPGNLIVEQGKVKAQLYVLGRHNEGTLPTLLGWETRAAVLAAPVKDFGYGILNHYIPADRLRSMEHLDRRVGVAAP